MVTAARLRAGLLSRIYGFRRINFTVTVIGLLAIVGINSAAHASTILIDGWTHGDGRLTRDTTTGLDWLDLMVTDNVSVDDIVTNHFGHLVDMGFRPATLQEVATFFTDAGVIGDPAGRSVAPE